MADRCYVCWVFTTLLALLLNLAAGLDNGVGKTPAMGWNSWNTFRYDSTVATHAPALHSCNLLRCALPAVQHGDPRGWHGLPSTHLCSLTLPHPCPLLL
jgi:hypothetical protein